MKILYLSSEVVPFAKTGGLADVAGALPKALAEEGHEVVLFLPRYKCVTEGPFTIESTGMSFEIPVGDQSVFCSIERTSFPDSQIPVYLVGCERYFDRDGLYQEKGRDYPDNLERFVLFCRAVLVATELIGFQPDIVHANDWQTALVPVYLENEHQGDPFFENTKTVFTIHNLAYQGQFPAEQWDLTGLDWKLFSVPALEFYGELNLMKGGLIFADHLTTVSRRYSEEIQTEDFGCGLDGVLNERKDFLTGILNGVDYSQWDPRTDPLIPENYSHKDLSGKEACKEKLQKQFGLPTSSKTALLGIISRLADQKGFDILADMFDYLMALPVQFVLLGTGDPEYHTLFEDMSRRFPDRCAVALTFDNTLAHRIEAGADFFLMPSRYEPCGLNQMYSLRYGTVPIVRETGGLADTIQEYDPETKEGNGFVFQLPEPKEFFWAIKRGIDVYYGRKGWKGLMKRAMKQDFSWHRSAKEYLKLYKSISRVPNEPSKE